MSQAQRNIVKDLLATVPLKKKLNRRSQKYTYGIGLIPYWFVTFSLTVEILAHSMM